MINNFFDDEPAYHPYNKIHTHDVYHYHIFLGDISSALDVNFIKDELIKAGTSFYSSVVTASAGMDHVKYDASVKHIVYPLLDVKT
jgi:hypothetical protein